MMHQNTLVKKFIVCMVAGATTSAVILILGNSGSITWFPPVVVFSLVGLTLLTAVVFPFAWHFTRLNATSEPHRMFGILDAVIRYAVAFDIATFGWKKLLGLQFIVPGHIASRPMNEQSGEWLTWFYFGHSPVIGFLLALLQLAGAYLLLLPRTRLVALLVLLVFLFNLTLINICYQMNAGALLQSVVLTIGVSYLITPYLPTLYLLVKEASRIQDVQPRVHPGAKLAGASAIVLAYLFTLYLQLAHT